MSLNLCNSTQCMTSVCKVWIKGINVDMRTWIKPRLAKIISRRGTVRQIPDELLFTEHTISFSFWWCHQVWTKLWSKAKYFDNFWRDVYVQLVQMLYRVNVSLKIKLSKSKTVSKNWAKVTRWVLDNIAYRKLGKQDKDKNEDEWWVGTAVQSIQTTFLQNKLLGIIKTL